jgi:hypothetical protein
MDPNEALRRLRAAVAALGAIPAADGTPLAEHGADVLEHWEALDQWLTRGGFLPDGWAQHGPTYTVAQIRNGTGFTAGTRFLALPDRPEPVQLGLGVPTPDGHGTGTLDA